MTNGDGGNFVFAMKMAKESRDLMLSGKKEKGLCN